MEEFISEIKLKSIEKSVRRATLIHLFVIEKYETLGFDETHQKINICLKNWTYNSFKTSQAYLKNRMSKYNQFEPYKDELLKICLEAEEDNYEIWAVKKKNEGFSKQKLYEIFLELFVYIQYHIKTKNEDLYYDILTSFLDRFTDWGGNFKIFPDEPDCL